MPHVVTTAYDEELLGSDTVGGVQTFCPQFQHWHSEAQRAEYHARQASTDRIGGEEAWWYGCNNPMAPFPTYHLDDDMIASRVLSWMQYEYDCDGNLYWCVNNSKEEMWETADAIGGAVCEGNLTYPAKKFGTKEPLSTLRLESIREGMEDFDHKRLDGPVIDVRDLAEALDAMPFFGGRTFVELRGFDINKCRDEETASLLADVPEWCTVVITLPTGKGRCRGAEINTLINSQIILRIYIVFL